MDIVQNLWMLLILPLMAAVFIFIPNGYMSLPKRRITLFLTLFSTALSLILTLVCTRHLVIHPNDFFESNILFINAGAFKIHLGVLLDNISAFMLMILYLIALPVCIFSYKYMKNEEGFSRYFILLNMLVFSMTGLILSTNLIQFFIFWELLGAFSYLLTGFYHKKPEAQRAARKAFLINRIGDFALFIAVLGFISFAIQDTENIIYPLLSLNDVNSWGFLAYVQLGTALYTGICLLITLAASIKSAQIPFQIWLVEAMEAPIPINALIHSAATISAGVYLLIRVYPALILSPSVLKTIAIIGIITALVCAIIAISQNDIKKILAFSTSSQAGLMLTALGCGAYSGSIFHLGMHGIIKAMMFLITGIIIQKTLSSNIKFLGGLREHFPLLAAGWLLGALSLSGLFFSGFYSREMVMSHLYSSNQILYLWLFVLAGILSILYLFRSYFLMFEGNYKGSIDFSKDNDLPYNGIDFYLLCPAAFLAFLSAFLGGFMAPDFQRYIYIIRQKFYLIRHPELEISIFITAGIIIYIMWHIYGVKRFKIKKVRFIYRLVVLQFYINKIFEWLYKIFIKGTAKVFAAIDEYVIKGFWAFMGQIARFGSYLGLRLQNGNLTAYIFSSFLFVVLILLCAVMVYFKGISNYGG